VTQPKVSALRNYKLAGFWVERLMNLLTGLDQDVEIVIRRKPARGRLVGLASSPPESASDASETQGPSTTAQILHSRPESLSRGEQRAPRNSGDGGSTNLGKSHLILT
jgi:hypothetical protein